MTDVPDGYVEVYDPRPTNRVRLVKVQPDGTVTVETPTEADVDVVRETVRRMLADQKAGGNDD